MNSPKRTSRYQLRNKELQENGINSPAHPKNKKRHSGLYKMKGMPPVLSKLAYSFNESPTHNHNTFQEFLDTLGSVAWNKKVSDNINGIKKEQRTDITVWTTPKSVTLSKRFNNKQGNYSERGNIMNYIMTKHSPLLLKQDFGYKRGKRETPILCIKQIAGRNFKVIHTRKEIKSLCITNNSFRKNKPLQISKRPKSQLKSRVQDMKTSYNKIQLIKKKRHNINKSIKVALSTRNKQRNCKELHKEESKSCRKQSVFDVDHTKSTRARANRIKLKKLFRNIEERERIAQSNTYSIHTIARSIEDIDISNTLCQIHTIQMFNQT